MDISQSVWDMAPGISASEINWPTLLAIKTSNLWALVDGVNWPEIQSILAEHLPSHACLYSTTDPDSQRIAPWLIRIEPDSPLLNLLQHRDPDTHAFVLFHSSLGLKQLRDHFRHFTLLWTPANTDAPVYFRFYDPRVLLDMACALTGNKLMQFYAGIDAFYAPLSARMRLPESTGLEAMLPGEQANAQGRLIQLTLQDSTQTPARSARSFRVNQSEYEAFLHLAQQRSPLNLAAELYTTHKQMFPAELYQKVALIACQQAPGYNLTTQNGLRILASCLLWLGPEFPQNDLAAEILLTDEQPDRIHHLHAWLQTNQSIEVAKAAWSL
ncbi:DUF4123 domain-containing protein [Nitrincola sp.]|uniref:DUF4123 domain-containing protein n=1 Tax=Nitrincola sp. TaxID=1926584 RepID=UPI003A90881D